MTMIACTLNKGGPILLGDILVSDEEKPEEFILPTLSEDIFKYLPTEGALYPVCLNQKMYILAPNVCIAFAGKLFYIKRFLEDIRIYCNTHKELTFAIIEKFLKEKEDESWKEFSCIILISQIENGDLHLCKALHGNWSHATSETFEDVWATGSGSLDFLIETNQKVKVVTQFVPEDPRHALQTNTVLLAQLLSRERAQLHTVKKHWGAGFEMIYFDKNHFTKIDNITYVINQGLVNPDGTVPTPIPSIVLHYKYHGDVLLITCIRTFGGQTTETDTQYIIRSTNFSLRPFIVIPLDYTESLDFSEITKRLAFKNEHNAMGYIIETKTGLYLPASVNIGPELQVSFNDEEGLTIIMEKEVNDRMIREAKTELLN